MTSRELPRAEWPRLAGTVIADAQAILPPDARIVVVEDHGTLVAHAAVIRYVHLEGVAVVPAHQKRGVAFGRLLDEVREVARSWDAGAIWTGVMTDEWRRLVTHLEGRQISGDHFAFPAEGPRCRG